VDHWCVKRQAGGTKWASLVSVLGVAKGTSPECTLGSRPMKDGSKTPWDILRIKLFSC